MISLEQIKEAAYHDELRKIAQEIDDEIDVHKATGLNYDDGQIDVHKRNDRPSYVLGQVDMHKAKGIRYNIGKDRTEEVKTVDGTKDGVYRKDVTNGFNPNSFYVNRKVKYL